MQVELNVDNSFLLPGEKFSSRLQLVPGKETHVIGGYAFVQGYFTIGDALDPEPFTKALNHGVVVARRHSSVSSEPPKSTLLSGVLDGIKKHLVIGSNENQGTYTIVSTQQEILFTDMTISEPCDFDIKIALPENIPPSYRSSTLTITYQMVVCFQTLLGPLAKPIASQLAVPLRVYSGNEPPKLDLTVPFNTGANRCGTPSIVQELQDYMDKLQQEGRSRHKRRTSSIALPHCQTTFEFAKPGESPIATLYLCQSAVCAGEMMFARLKLTPGCFHVVVYLESVEQIADEYARNVKSSTKVYAWQAMRTYALEELSLHLNVPISVSPTLETVQVSTSWRLRVEISTIQELPFLKEQTDVLLAKPYIETELISAKIPITIKPPSEGHKLCKTWKLSS